MERLGEYKLVDVDELVASARNARKHSDAQVQQIAGSIVEFGFLAPVICDGNGILAGHGRVLAAKKLGLLKVPVVEADWLTPDQKRAYVIADNKLALNADWDSELLKIELADLAAEGFDTSLIGFSEVELDAILEAVGANDAVGEWQSMPEFEQPDAGPFRTLQVHFKDQAGVDDFAGKVGLAVHATTRYLWFPEIEIDKVADKRVVSSE